MSNKGMITTALAILKDDGMKSFLLNQGASPSDWKKFVGSKLWNNVDRSKVRNIADSILFGVTDLQGIERTKLPAELIASVGAIFVSPVNWLAFADFYQNANTLNQLKNANDQAESGVFEEGMTRSRIYALILDYSNCVITGDDADFRNTLIAKLTKTPTTNTTNG